MKLLFVQINSSYCWKFRGKVNSLVNCTTVQSAGWPTYSPAAANRTTAGRCSCYSSPSQGHQTGLKKPFPKKRFSLLVHHL